MSTQRKLEVQVAVHGFDPWEAIDVGSQKSIERTLLDLKHSVGYFSEDLEEEELELSYHIEVIKTTIYLWKKDEKENYDDLIHQQSLLNLLEFNQAIQEVV